MSDLILTCDCGNRMPIRKESLGTVGRCTLCGRELKATQANTAPAHPEATAPAARPATLAPTAQPRLLSLDQLRGYAIAGMIFVNYMGHFEWVPKVFHHTKDVFSYADTIAPLFIFVVGMGFRLSLKRRAEQKGLNAARWDSFKRYFILFIVGVLFYGPTFRIDWWDALIQIALSGMLCLLFIDKSVGVRLAVGAGYLLLFNVLYFQWGQTGEYSSYAEWMTHRSMNGGFLSPLAYAFVLMCGTIAYDLINTRDDRKIFLWSGIAIAGCLMAAFIAWSLLPKEELSFYAEHGHYWTTSKRWSLAPFILIATALAFAAFVLFYWLNDVRGIEIPTLTVMGMNPLVIYLLQFSLLAIHGSYLPEEAHPVWGWVGLVVFYGVCYAAAWRLWKDKTIIKL